MRIRLAAATALAALAITPTPAFAESPIALNHVWSRIADINGEFGSVESAEFSADGRYIATGTKFDYSVRIFRVSDGFQTFYAEVPQEIERVAWTPDGKYIASASEDYMLRVFDVESGEVVFSYKHDNGIDGLAVSPDGRYLVTGQEYAGEGRNRGGAGRVFSVGDWELLRTIRHPTTVNEIDFTPDGKHFALVGGINARVYSVGDWRLRHDFALEEELEITGKPIKYINGKFSPDGSMLLVGGQAGYIWLYSLAQDKMLRVFNKSGQKTETVEWTKDGKYVAVAGHGATIDFFPVADLVNDDMDNDAIRYALRAPVSDDLEYMHFNASGTMLTTAHQDGTVQLWTFMSDDPLINARRHQEVKDAQRRAAEGN